MNEELEKLRENEDWICEQIFQWWISGKPYKKWFTDNFLQMKIDFDEQFCNLRKKY